jgi:hypothetical protein
MAAKTHPATLRWPPSLFGFAGKRGLEAACFYFLLNVLIISIQAPLSTAGEERG